MPEEHVPPLQSDPLTWWTQPLTKKAVLIPSAVTLSHCHPGAMHISFPGSGNTQPGMVLRLPEVRLETAVPSGL